MIKRVRSTKVGDIFCAVIDGQYKMYLQYIVSDITQLNSDVIRAFKKKYSLDDSPELAEIVKDEVAFYAHCCTRAGIKREYWEWVGNISDVGPIEPILFRSSEDEGHRKGEEPVKTSFKWWIWKVNEEHKYVGKLEGENRKAEIGGVFPPKYIVKRMQTGMYGGVYPSFE
jgi:hypothetical protein